MSIIKIKYRPVIYIISLFYLNFFLLFPFFHSHHSESEFSNEKSTLIHSHLFSNVDKSGHPEETNHHFEDENHHIHLIQNKSIYSITPTRDFLFSLNIDFYTTSANSKIDRQLSAIATPTIQGFSKDRWIKYVHSATNVSPPLV